VDGREVGLPTIRENALLPASEGKARLWAEPNRGDDRSKHHNSQQLTLWNQKGSRVIRGKQIVTPIENSFLYVVPLYLTAQAPTFRN